MSGYSQINTNDDIDIINDSDIINDEEEENNSSEKTVSDSSDSDTRTGSDSSDSDSESADKKKNSKIIEFSEAIEIVDVGFYQYFLLFLCIGGRLMQSLQFYTLPYLYPIIKKSPSWKLHDWHIAACNSTIYIGMFISAILVTQSDSLGRKVFFTYFHFTFTCLSFILVFSPNYWVFLISHFFTSFASMLVDEIMLLEVIKYWQRGIFISMFDIFFSLGNVFSSILCYFLITLLGNYVSKNFKEGDVIFFFFSNENSWRIVLFCVIFPVFCLGIVRILFVYESPRWCIAHKQNKRAIQILRKIQIINNFFKGNSDGETEEKNILDYQIKEEETESLTAFQQIKGLFSAKFLSTTSLILLGTFFFSFAYGGLFLIVPLLFHEVDNAHAYLGLAVASFFDVTSMFSMVFLIDLLPRRIYFFVMALLTFCFIIALPLAIPLKSIIYATVIYCGLVFIKDFPFNIMMIYCSEVFPTPIRGTGQGLYTFFSSFANIIASPILLAVKNYTGSFAAFYICGICFIIAGIIYMLLPYETRNKEIADSLDEKCDMYKTSYLFFPKKLNRKIDAGHGHVFDD